MRSKFSTSSPRLIIEFCLKKTVGQDCHTAKSSRYELLIPESVWIDNIGREREKLKQLVNVNACSLSEP